MTRAVLPNPSARAEWLLAGIIDRALHHWGHVSPLDGGIGERDHADSETPSPVNRQHLCSHQASSYPLLLGNLLPLFLRFWVTWSLALSSKITGTG